MKMSVEMIPNLGTSLPVMYGSLKSEGRRL